MLNTRNECFGLPVAQGRGVLRRDHSLEALGGALAGLSVPVELRLPAELALAVEVVQEFPQDLVPSLFGNLGCTLERLVAHFKFKLLFA